MVLVSDCYNKLMPSTKFLKITSDEQAIDFISNKINRALATNKKVLWLVSGGSFVPIAVSVRNNLKNTTKLTVTLTDERYGPPGHKDSNWQRLLEAGFNFSNIQSYALLNGEKIAETTFNFDSFLKGRFDFHLGTFGMGADGHTAGILPDSKLSDSQKLAEFYVGPDFERITVTPKYIASLEQAIVYARGESKHKAIDNYSKALSVESQPVQILKSIASTIFINDYKGDSFENYN